MADTKIKDIYIIVTSVIYFANGGFSYSDKRSNYNPEQRIFQTIETINSIKKYIPQAKIILVESWLQNIYENLWSQIINNLYKYIYIWDQRIVRLAVDSRRKGFWETIWLLFGTPKENLENSLYFKFSGRYRINENFDINKFGKNWFSFLSKNLHHSTRFYSWSGSYFWIWKIFLILSLPFLLLNISIEKILYMLIPWFMIHKVDMLGISGEIWTDWHKIDE